jgi:hypothetical protein
MGLYPIVVCREGKEMKDITFIVQLVIGCILLLISGVLLYHGTIMVADKLDVAFGIFMLSMFVLVAAVACRILIEAEKSTEHHIL